MPTLYLDRESCIVNSNGQQIQLDSLEFDILWVMSSLSVNSISFRQLLFHLEELDSFNAKDNLNNAIERLSRKLPHHQMQFQGDDFISIN